MKAAVIGGGFAGLVAALALGERGHDVSLFERRGVLGGRATSYSDSASGDEVDSGVPFLLEGFCTSLEWLSHEDAAGFLLHGLRWPGSVFETARRLWLRQDPHRVDPAILGAVESVLRSSDAAARPVFFRTGLGRVHEHLARRFVARGGVIRKRALVEQVETNQGRVRVRLLQRAQGREAIRAGGRPSRETVDVDCAVVAAPWHAAAALFEQGMGGPALAAVARLSGLPAVTIEAWLDGALPLEPVTESREPGIDWILDKGQLHGRTNALQHLAFSVTPDAAARDRTNASWVALAHRALESSVAPAQAPAFQRAVVLREPLAFYPCDAESSRVRAAAAEAVIEGVFLAGDWTVANLPACIEAAVQSGLREAERAAERG